jgi:RimJ/RimL family protein N-acetyltransferase
MSLSMDIPTLETPRLFLRAFRPADFESYAAMSANPEVMRYIDDVQDRESAFRSFCASIGHWAVRGYGPWAVEERASGRVVGRAGLFHWERWPAIEVGYLLDPSAWGKGYATEAAQRSLRYAHETVGARGVVAFIQPENVASVRVVEKLGGRFEREVLDRKKRPVRIYLFRDPS